MLSSEDIKIRIFPSLPALFNISISGKSFLNASKKLKLAMMKKSVVVSSHFSLFEMPMFHD